MHVFDPPAQDFQRVVVDDCSVTWTQWTCAKRLSWCLMLLSPSYGRSFSEESFGSLVARGLAPTGWRPKIIRRREFCLQTKIEKPCLPKEVFQATR